VSELSYVYYFPYKKNHENATPFIRLRNFPRNYTELRYGLLHLKQLRHQYVLEKFETGSLMNMQHCSYSERHHETHFFYCRNLLPMNLSGIKPLGACSVHRPNTPIWRRVCQRAGRLIDRVTAFRHENNATFPPTRLSAFWL
jgi:hypothetical protein